jgi:hypothetical protein
VRARDHRGRARFLFASDALYGFNLDRGALHATVARSSRYTLDVEEPNARLPRGEPVIDRGEFRFRFILGAADLRVVTAAEFLEEPPIVATLPVRP